MSPYEIAAAVVSVLLTVSRFLLTLKPVWGRAPQWLARAIPVVVFAIQPMIDLLRQTKSATDLINYGLGALVLLVVNLFPSHEPPAPPAVVQS